VAPFAHAEVYCSANEPYVAQRVTAFRLDTVDTGGERVLHECIRVSLETKFETGHGATPSLIHIEPHHVSRFYRKVQITIFGSVTMPPQTARRYLLSVPPNRSVVRSMMGAGLVFILGKGFGSG
jgi:hypothetical protein